VPFRPKKVEISGPPFQTAQEMDFPPSKSIRPTTYKKTGTLVILWTRDFRAQSEMVSNTVSSGFCLMCIKCVCVWAVWRVGRGCGEFVMRDRPNSRAAGRKGEGCRKRRWTSSVAIGHHRVPPRISRQPFRAAIRRVGGLFFQVTRSVEDCHDRYGGARAMPACPHPAVSCC
jgi:hypothetical protein